MKINSNIGNFKHQVIIALIINLFAGIANSGYFLFTGALHHDNWRLYNYFHDNLQSLNYFGEPSWWFPEHQFGFPAYYYSLLGDMNCGSPIFVLLGLIFWLLGLIGIRITSIQPIYVLYFGFIVPFLFSFGVLLVARQLAFANKTIIFILILSAFSPGVIVNLSDVGFLEPVAYSLYFAAAYLNFIRTHKRNSFWMLCLSLLVICVSVNYTYLVWTIWFIPIFVIVVLLLGDRYSQKARTAVIGINKWEIFISVLLAALCLLPNLVTLSHGQDIVRSGIYQAQYSFLDIRVPGQPTEALFASSPGSSPLGTSYLGLLALPLAVLGLILGDFRKSWRLVILFCVFFGIVLISAHSPIFGLILYIVSPLRAMSHYHDLLYRGGGFVLIIAAAALGFETLFSDRNTKGVRWFALITFIGLGLISTYIVSMTHGFGSPLYGFTLLMVFLFSIALAWLAISSPSKNKKAAIAYLILFLTFVDISTPTFIYIRSAMFGKGESQNYDIISDNFIGLKDPTSNTYANILQKLKHSAQVESLGVPLQELPRFGLFAKAHIYEDAPQAKDVKMIVDAGSSASSLAIPKQAAQINEFKPFIDRLPAQKNQSLGTVQLKAETYNSFSLQVSASESALLFVKDAYFPYWQATVNGKQVPIVRAIAAFKALPVPTGNSEVKLIFAPPAIGWLLLIAYISIIGIAILCLILSNLETSQREIQSVIIENK